MSNTLNTNSQDTAIFNRLWPLFMCLLSSLLGYASGFAQDVREPLVRTVDLNLGETASVSLVDGSTAQLKLIRYEERLDSLRFAIRSSQVTLEVNGTRIQLQSGNYNLPITVFGVRIDCPITKGYSANAGRDMWSLAKDVRLRVWPEDSPLIAPETFVYPLKQRWFASATQMANEPTYVNGDEQPDHKTIYYHNDLDLGGCEGLIDVIAATEGLVISSGDNTLTGYEDSPAAQRYDVVYILDERGWYYRYSHLQSIEPAIVPGARVKLSQKIGVLGKEGGSGGWSHLHFGIVSKQPSGEWGTQEAYAFVWESYLRDHKPAILAVARPHHFAAVGEAIHLDASKSRSFRGVIQTYQWEFADGAQASGPIVKRTYEKAGMYSELLRVEDTRGNVDYDFSIVQVIDAEHPDKPPPPTIHSAYAPATNLKPGDKITFKVRTFRTTDGVETWDFGDGSPPVTVKSDGNLNVHAEDGYAVTHHRYQFPGTYIVRVHRTNTRNETAHGGLVVHVVE